MTLPDIASCLILKQLVCHIVAIGSKTSNWVLAGIVSNKVRQNTPSTERIDVKSSN